LHAFPTRQAITSFGRCSSPGHIKHGCNTSCQSTSHTVLESVLLKSLDWSWKSAFLANPFARNHRHNELLWHIMDSAAVICNNRESIPKATYDD
jgi:hypothetical protein